MRQPLGIALAIWQGMIQEAHSWRGALAIGIVLGAAIARVIWRSML